MLCALRSLLSRHACDLTTTTHTKKLKFGFFGARSPFKFSAQGLSIFRHKAFQVLDLWSQMEYNASDEIPTACSLAVSERWKAHWNSAHVSLWTSAFYESLFFNWFCICVVRIMAWSRLSPQAGERNRSSLWPEASWRPSDHWKIRWGRELLVRLYQFGGKQAFYYDILQDQETEVSRSTRPVWTLCPFYSHIWDLPGFLVFLSFGLLPMGFSCLWMVWYYGVSYNFHV